MSSDPPPPDADVRAQMRRWLDNWKRMGPGLEAERITRLQQLDDVESARIAREIVWPMGTLGDHRGGDDGAGILPLMEAVRKLGAAG